MPSQVATTPLSAPIPIPPPRRNLGLITTQELFASLNATLASKSDELVTPVRHIQEQDYSVPAPPPPSPNAGKGEKEKRQDPFVAMLTDELSDSGEKALRWFLLGTLVLL
ncbi:uncharacterized protein P884DRAFT_301163 [Thermothelomyces heterothallicus CBS 202.75]|uniref:uncharacterized protein n=1 Tax=Thermothelomyces heterothallicus CBS 202.75 TaxID=1149848 RepID=UPI00374347AF